MERDLNLLLAEGWSRDAVLAAVLFSVRDNYLSKVVMRRVESNGFRELKDFQGIGYTHPWRSLAPSEPEV